MYLFQGPPYQWRVQRGRLGNAPPPRILGGGEGATPLVSPPPGIPRGATPQLDLFGRQFCNFPKSFHRPPDEILPPP